MPDAHADEIARQLDRLLESEIDLQTTQRDLIAEIASRHTQLAVVLELLRQNRRAQAALIVDESR